LEKDDEESLVREGEVAKSPNKTEVLNSATIGFALIFVALFIFYVWLFIVMYWCCLLFMKLQ
jgi:hypothetical protein